MLRLIVVHVTLATNAAFAVIGASVGGASGVVLALVGVVNILIVARSKRRA